MADTPALPERLSDNQIEGLRRSLVAGGALGATMKRFDRLVAEVRDLRRAAPVASPAEGEAKRKRCPKTCPCTCHEGCSDWEHPGEPCPGKTAASPRREAPADADEAHAALVEQLWQHLDEDLGWEDEHVQAIADDLTAAGYQLVPAGYHVSPEGQTVIDGKRWEVRPQRYIEPKGQAGTSLARFHAAGEDHDARLRPVGTEEADTDE